jgi:hypothetical protein
VRARLQSKQRPEAQQSSKSVRGQPLGSPYTAKKARRPYPAPIAAAASARTVQLRSSGCRQWVPPMGAGVIFDCFTKHAQIKTNIIRLDDRPSVQSANSHSAVRLGGDRKFHGNQYTGGGAQSCAPPIPLPVHKTLAPGDALGAGDRALPPRKKALGKEPNASKRRLRGTAILPPWGNGA